MNIVEVQENLKNFSQDQLINEINQPSGMVPQFLVLTELGRRNRMKQDIEGRQAQNQPTVAQEVVSAAGVPQGGIMDMARSMAPKSSIEQNDGVQMMEEGGKPKNRMEMLLAYLRSLGADEEEEIKEATGGKSIAEIINFGGDFRPVEKADGGVVKMQMAGSPTREVVYGGKRYITDGSGRVFNSTRRGSMRRGQEVTNPEIISGVLGTGPNVMSQTIGNINLSDIYSDTAPSSSLSPINPVVKPELGIYGSPTSILDDSENLEPQPKTDASVQKAISEIAGIGSTDFMTATATEAENQNREDSLSTFPIRNVFQDNQPQDPINFSSTRKRRKDRDKNEIKEQADSNVSGRNDPPRLDRNEFGLETEDIPFSEIPGFGDTPRTPIGSGRGRLQDIPTTPTTDPDTDTDTDPDPNSAISSLESEIANMLKENEEDREKDKYLALAKMGLALMSSSQPTFGGALGEAGMAGLDDLQASRQSYRDDKITLLDAQRKLEQARATAASKDKSGLTGSNIVSTLNNIRNQKAKAMSDLSKINPSFEGGELSEKQKNDAEMLRREIANLTVMESTYAGMLGGIGSLSSSGVDLNATAN